MTHPDASRWNERYSAEGDSWLARSPRQLLVDHAHLLSESGLALDAAAGVATNGLFLAENGLTVIALDISETALRLAHQRFARAGFDLGAAVFDLTDPWLPAERFEVILNFHFLERGAFSAYRRALKPGGILIFETFLSTGSGMGDCGYYLLPGELAARFQGFEILHSAQSKITDEAGEIVKTTDQLVARKPR